MVSYGYQITLNTVPNLMRDPVKLRGPQHEFRKKQSLRRRP